MSPRANLVNLERVTKSYGVRILLDEVSLGVGEGDRVVVAANFLIDAESNLRAALRGLTAAAPAGEGGR